MASGALQVTVGAAMMIRGDTGLGSTFISSGVSMASFGSVMASVEDEPEMSQSQETEKSQNLQVTPENINEVKLAQSSTYERALAATTDKFVETRKTLEHTYDKVQEHASNLKAKFKGFADKAVAFKDDMMAKFTTEQAVSEPAMTASELTESDAPQIETAEPVLPVEEQMAQVEALRAERAARLASLEQEEIAPSITPDRSSEGDMMNEAWADAMAMEEDHSR